jgi:hypothetical protein
LLETLIALAIFSTAMLGMGAMCLRSLQYTREALYHSFALIHVESLATLANVNPCSNHLDPSLCMKQFTLWQQEVEHKLPEGKAYIQCLHQKMYFKLSWQQPLQTSLPFQRSLILTVGSEGHALQSS